MALEFRKRRFRKPAKKGQLVLALITLCLALIFASMWIAANLIANAPTDDTENDPSSSIQPTYTAEDVGNLLVILRSEQDARFVLLQCIPQEGIINALGLPSNTTAADGESTLYQTLQKYGEAAATSLAADVLDIPLRQHVSFTRDAFIGWLEYLGNDLSVQLEDVITYKNASGKSTRLEPQEHLLNAKETDALIWNNSIKDSEKQCSLTASIAAAVVNQNLQSSRYLLADFYHIADETKTSLRIGDFNDYRDILQALADIESDNKCKVVELHGSADGKFYHIDADRIDLFNN